MKYAIGNRYIRDERQLNGIKRAVVWFCVAMVCFLIGFQVARADQVLERAVELTDGQPVRIYAMGMTRWISISNASSRHERGSFIINGKSLNVCDVFINLNGNWACLGMILGRSCPVEFLPDRLQTP